MQKKYAQKAVNQASINTTKIKLLQIPLPPLEIQKEIVKEIEGYERVIEGARQVIESWKPTIKIDPKWPIVALGKICEINSEVIDPKNLSADIFNYIDISSVENGTGRFLGSSEISKANAPSRARRIVHNNDVLLSTVRPNLKAFMFVQNLLPNSIASTGFAVLKANSKK